MPAFWTLAELTELDAQLRGNAVADAVYSPELPTDRPEALRAWLLRSRLTHPEASKRAALAIRSERFLRPALFLLFFLSGLGTAAALLVYDGSRLINVGVFLGVLVGSQLLMLAARALLALFLRRPPKVQTLFLPALLRDHLDSPALPAWRARLMIDFQLAGAAFNLGALNASLGLLLARDLAFGWESTLLNRAESIHNLVRFLSAPWGGAFAPSLAEIDASRILLLQGQSHVLPEAAAAWWPFLLLCLCVYGLLPRLLLVAYGHFRLRRALHRAPIPSAASDRLFLTLTRPPVTFQGDGDPDALESKSPTPPLAALNPTAPLRLEVSEELLDPSQRENLRTRLPFALTDDPAAGRVFLVEAWQPPLEETLRQLRELRRELGPTADLLVLAVGLPSADPQQLFQSPDPGDVEVWRSRLSGLRDPHLGLLAWKETA